MTSRRGDQRRWLVTAQVMNDTLLDRIQILWL
jgi:hypothetical protein